MNSPFVTSSWDSRTLKQWSILLVSRWYILYLAGLLASRNVKASCNYYKQYLVNWKKNTRTKVFLVVIVILSKFRCSGDEAGATSWKGSFVLADRPTLCYGMPTLIFNCIQLLVKELIPLAQCCTHTTQFPVMIVNTLDTTVPQENQWMFE